MRNTLEEIIIELGDVLTNENTVGEAKAVVGVYIVAHSNLPIRDKILLVSKYFNVGEDRAKDSLEKCLQVINQK